ncbi:MAG: right-handed parallel beta-helix repeat-containing protein [Lachnospiraceae bacterium]|nr:right-handed parallel beta-helix repeat-containing protein [Lachnospiraceae bacterium]
MKIYVDAKTTYQGNGSKESPFKTINAAAQIAVAGDEVLVAPGVYREAVDPLNAGSEDNRIVYRSVVPNGAIITGAEKVDNWEKYEGTTWVAKINNGVFGNFNPYKEIVFGDWYLSPRNPETGEFMDYHRGAVFMNDRQLYETLTLEDCIKGEKSEVSWEPEHSVYKWYTVQDKDETVIYANFQDKNPNEENVEILVRKNCFWPSKKGIGYITVSGFEINKAATNWAPPAAYQEGMIGPHWSKGWVIEDCEIWGSRCCGISLGNYHQTEKDNDNYFSHKHIKSPTQMERDAVCIAQYDGWTKETVGSHIIRRCHVHDCGQAGIVGRMGGVFSIIEDNDIHHNNITKELEGAEIGGIKLHAAIDVTFRRNHIHHNTIGIWIDWEAQGTRITQNLFHDNFLPDNVPMKEIGMGYGEDLFIEIGHGPVLVDNNLLLSRTAIRWATQGVALVHNLILGSFSVVGGGTDMIAHGKNQPRYTPYHMRHRTEVAGFMTVLHGDNRIYNNIIVQKWNPLERIDDPSAIRENERLENGTFWFDEYPTYDEWISKFRIGERVDWMSMRQMIPVHFESLPVWIDGNAYFNGAKAWNREQNKLVDTENEVFVNLIEKDGKYTVETNVYKFLKEFQNGIINSDILGEAFEPEQRYENPDGTDIIFDEDYFGNHRGIATIPGPVAAGEELTEFVW